LTNSIDGLLKQFPNFQRAPERSLGQIMVDRCPTSILSSALAAEFCKSLWMTVKETQTVLDYWRIAIITGFRSSLTTG